MSVTANSLTHRLSELARKFQVPGATVAVLAEGEVTEAAYGTLNMNTGVEATTDSLFQIGSISKVYTATLVLRLVDDGVLDLDEPVVRYLPEFAVADPDVTRRVTIRQLLSHTSGIDGDRFDDTGRGDDCLERYVAGIANAVQSHPLGATMSYCNTAYVTLGRLIEVVTGITWDAALRERLVAPLGLTHTVTLPEEALLYRAALGHISLPGQPPTPAPVWGPMRAGGPAGLICARAADVIAFAQMHLDDGSASDGTRILSQKSVASMQHAEVAVPDRWSHGPIRWGLGWIIFNWEGRKVYGHDGGTIGQYAFLRVVPDAKVAVCLLTNGGHADELYRELFTELLRDLADVRLPAPPQPPADPVTPDAADYLGKYQRASAEIEAAMVDGVLELTLTATGALAAIAPDPVQKCRLVGLDSNEHAYLAQFGVDSPWTPVVFFTLPDGSRYVHTGLRSTPKVS